MFTNLGLALIVGVLTQTQAPPSTAPTAEAAVTAALAKATTPAECVIAVRAYLSKRQQEARPATGWTNDALKKVTDEKVAYARSCADRYSLGTTRPGLLAGLADLFVEAGQPEKATEALVRARTDKTLTEAERADMLGATVRNVLKEPKGDERNARLEKMVDELDALPAAYLDQKFTAHMAMNSYYRYDDIDSGIIKHSTWLIDAVKAGDPAMRTKYAPRIVSAYVNIAEAWAGQGRNDDAIALLRRAAGDLPEVPGDIVTRSVQPEIERLQLVGTPAAALTAPRWLNMPGGKSDLDMKGQVSLLEFSAHWCIPCKESYPGVNRLLAAYGPKGFRVVLATQMYGYFEKEQGLTPEVEFERDKTYFAEHGMNVPIAVGNRSAATIVEGRLVAPPTPDPNNAHYKVGGIPQIHLIDKQGRVRLVMVGYDDANEAKLAKMIEGMLAEK